MAHTLEFTRALRILGCVAVLWLHGAANAAGAAPAAAAGLVDVNPAATAAADAASAPADAASGTQRPALPPAVTAVLNRLMRAPVTNPPRSLWQTQYKGRTVFLIPAECCDVPAAVLTTQGKVLCEPFGGFSGQGDGRCPDFVATRTAPRLLWKDPRAPAGSEPPKPR